jgi:hypothetical protein
LHQHPALHEDLKRGSAPSLSEGEKANKACDNHTTEFERLVNKKRKRMDKRREYEEEVQLQLQSSSDSSVAQVFDPGQYMSMEDSLSFTNTAR